MKKSQEHAAFEEQITTFLEPGDHGPKLLSNAQLHVGKWESGVPMWGKGESDIDPDGRAFYQECARRLQGLSPEARIIMSDFQQGIAIAAINVRTSRRVTQLTFEVRPQGQNDLVGSQEAVKAGVANCLKEGAENSDEVSERLLERAEKLEMRSKAVGFAGQPIRHFRDSSFESA